ncbi:hypothetical protein HPB49_020328 [Dermacentor silvarum]|uniref:Uncharacterized protein n=1 Tax=Dermacentor silvarum TaxID=543639 RepID=A0ACB8DFS3_DERSI|nr:hypothetical protein HPB49_020328 [Dermacentor silvarum]
MCSTESVLRRAVIKYLNPTFSAKYFRRDNVLAIVTLSPVAVEFQPACSLAMNVLPPAPALPRPSSVTHSHIRTSFVCTCGKLLHWGSRRSSSAQLLNADSLFLTVQRSQNKPNTIIVRKGISHFPLLPKQRVLRQQSIASDDAFHASDVTIWFVESSNETDLKGRQACSIESASLHNPNVRVFLLTTGQLSPNCDYYKALSSLENFASLKLNLTDTFSNTPLDSWHRSRNWTEGPYRIEHLSDGIRLAVLWKHGGIYLDLDIIVLKELSELSNSVMFEVTGQLSEQRAIL